MTPLRQRMIDEMRRRNFSEKSTRGYVAAVAQLAQYFARSPETMSLDDIRKFQLHLRDERKLAWSTYRHGKGRKDRLVPLSAMLLELLRAWWRVFRPTTWLFPGADRDRSVSPRTVERAVERGVKAAASCSRARPCRRWRACRRGP